MTEEQQKQIDEAAKGLDSIRTTYYKEGARFGVEMTEKQIQSLQSQLKLAEEGLEKYSDIAFQYRPEGSVFAARDCLAKLREMKRKSE